MTDPDKTRITISSPDHMAEKVRRALMRARAMDPDRSIGKADGSVNFPVLLPGGSDPRCILGDLMEHLTVREEGYGTSPRERRRSPIERIRSKLAGMDPTLLDLVPDRWETVGDALVLRLDPALRDQRSKVARAFAEVLGSRMVLLDKEGVKGELREPVVEVLLPPKDGVMEVLHRENGILFRMDPTKVMFSSGNVFERDRARRLIAEVPLGRPGSLPDGGEIVFDMFAGIGYFSLPLAIGDRHCMVVACEKNPASFVHLVENISLNMLKGRVLPVLGDNRACLPVGVADRLLMGYIGGTVGYVGTAVRCLRPSGGILHLHDTVQVEDGAEHLMTMLRKEVEDVMPGRAVDTVSWRRVKSYAPRIEHLVLDISVGPVPPF